MADETKLAEPAYPLQPQITLEMSEQPQHGNFSIELNVRPSGIPAHTDRGADQAHAA